MRKSLIILLFLAGAAGGLLSTIFLQRGPALAQPRPHTPSTPPTLISYQGYLTDADQQPVQGTADLTFGLYASETGGSPLWTETQNDVLVEDGYFAVLLGNINPLIPADFADATRYLQVTVDTGSGPVVMPRQRLAAAPYAFQATTADTANSAPWGGLTGVPAGFADGVDNDTTYTAGYGLNLSNTTFQVVTTTIQARVSGRCEVGSTIQAVNADGSVDCERPTTFYYPLLRPQSLNLATVDPDLKGFIGGFTDGRYGYFVPHYNGVSYVGKVARIDLEDFSSGGVTVLNLATVDADLRGFFGGFTDGRYAYFVPKYNESGYFGKIARVDLLNFGTGGVAVLDLTTVDGDLRGFHGGFTDGRYGYFVPYANGPTFGKVARVDLQNFSAGGVTVLDLTSVDPDLKGFSGGFTDGYYGYFVPNENGVPFGKVARVDLQTFNADGVTVLDLTDVDQELLGFLGGFSDGRYGYFVPHNNGAYFGKVVRVDLQNFTPGGVNVLDLQSVNPDVKGFTGGFSDGRYGYLAPYHNGNDYSGKVARVDLLNFTGSSVTWIDMAATDPGLKGFNGGFTDGRYGYFVPYYNGAYAGTIARIQLFSGAGAP